MNPDSANVELETVKQSDEQEYVDDEVTQESGTFFQIDFYEGKVSEQWIGKIIIFTFWTKFGISPNDLLEVLDDLKVVCTLYTRFSQSKIEFLTY